MEPIHPQLTQAFALSEAGRNDEAVALIRALAGQGDTEAVFTLADMLWRGVLVPEDRPAGRKLFHQASDQGHPIALRATTNLMASGVAGPRDWPGALRRLAEEARGDYRRAHMLSVIEAMDLTPDGEPRAIPEPRLLSQSPHVLFFPALLTPAECEFLHVVAEPSYEPSMIGNDDPPYRRDPVRTSDGATMHLLIEDPAIHALNRRIAKAAGVPVDHGEPLHILRYRPGQEYKRHFDWSPGATNQRILTALVYLNEEYSGGETDFPRGGFRVRGRRGDCILFRNMGPDRQADPMSQHAGLPVTAGTKFLATRWIREQPWSQ